VCVCVLGRAGKKGIAVSFFTADDGRKARKLIDVLREAKQVKKKRECHLHIFALFMCGYYYFELCLLLTNMFCVCVCVCMRVSLSLSLPCGVFLFFLCVQRIPEQLYRISRTVVGSTYTHRILSLFMTDCFIYLFFFVLYTHTYTHTHIHTHCGLFLITQSADVVVLVDITDTTNTVLVAILPMAIEAIMGAVVIVEPIIILRQHTPPTLLRTVIILINLVILLIIINSQVVSRVMVPVRLNIRIYLQRHSRRKRMEFLINQRIRPITPLDIPIPLRPVHLSVVTPRTVQLRSHTLLSYIHGNGNTNNNTNIMLEGILPLSSTNANVPHNHSLGFYFLFILIIIIL